MGGCLSLLSQRRALRLKEGNDLLEVTRLWTWTLAHACRPDQFRLSMGWEQDLGAGSGQGAASASLPIVSALPKGPGRAGQRERSRVVM